MCINLIILIILKCFRPKLIFEDHDFDGIENIPHIPEMNQQLDKINSLDKNDMY